MNQKTDFNGLSKYFLKIKSGLHTSTKDQYVHCSQLSVGPMIYLGVRGQLGTKTEGCDQQPSKHVVLR